MKLERRSLSRLTLPLKALVDRFAFAALIVLSLGLLALGKADVGLLESVDNRIGDALAPVLTALVQPIQASRDVARKAGELVALHEENARLREQNQRLMEWQAAARRLALENAGLRQVLHMETAPEHPTATAGRVVADLGGPFVHTVLVDAGTDQGVTSGMAAMNERGLAGRVIEVGRRSARVLLLTDFNSSIPVMIEPSRDQAILSGDNTGQPGLEFLPLNPRLSLGDRVVTSGRGGVLPPGLPIGVVSSIGDHKVAVAPFVDWARLEYLRLLEYAPVHAPEALPAPPPESYELPLPELAAPADNGVLPGVDLGPPALGIAPQGAPPGDPR
ncbi:MAG: rod shape-determining protein MreC [Geminicoccaceae bacterium]